MNPQDKFKCRVCGLDQFPELPWGETGRDPSHAICLCCGVEFGYDDDSTESCLSVRRNWVHVKHCVWFSPKDRPDNWDMSTQIKDIPSLYRSAEDDGLIRSYLIAEVSSPKGLDALSAVEKLGR